MPDPCIGQANCPVFIKGPGAKCLYITGTDCIDFGRVLRALNTPDTVEQKEVERRVPGAVGNSA